MTAKVNQVGPHDSEVVLDPDTPSSKTARPITDETLVQIRCLADVKPEPILWLWPDRIARGKLTLIAGQPGLGKSQIAISLAAVVSTGGKWPVDRTTCGVGNVLMLSAEDDAADTIRPRLDAAGADVRRCFILDAIKDVTEDGQLIQRSLNLSRDLHHLESAIDNIGEVSLIIIDPISAYLGQTDSHKNAEVRAVLAPLSEMAAKHRAAVVAITHLNKSTGPALSRVMGSTGFVAAARAAFVVAAHPNDEVLRVLLPMKNNIGNDSSGLSFQLEGATIGDGIKTSRVCWQSETVMISADQVLALPLSDDEKSVLGDAKEFLLDVLSYGSVTAKAIRKDASSAGISWRTIERAKAALGIESKKSVYGGEWRWTLPANKDPVTGNMAAFDIHTITTPPESKLYQGAYEDRHEGRQDPTQRPPNIQRPPSLGDGETVADFGGLEDEEL